MTADPAQKQLRQACTALDRALQAGEPARAEAWLDACPALGSDAELAVELIYSEYVARESVGPAPAPEEYFQRFPQFADRLRRLFQVDDLLKSSDDTAASSMNGKASTTTEGRPASSPPVPRQIGAYELLERIGGGAMGVVYRARQSHPKRDVALKLLRAGADAGAAELTRFYREAEAAARLQHPNIVTVYDSGTHEGQPYLALEFVNGGDLREHLAGRPQPPHVAAELIATLARAVQAAHEQGVVHRDLKPANVLVAGRPSSVSTLTSDHGPLNSVKITDFGLAALTTGDAARGLTRTGQMIGTIAYMAPEQAEGKPSGAQPPVDIYALGAIFYECLTGNPPFISESEAESLRQVVHEEPVPPMRLRPSLPRDLDTIVRKCLEKEPRRRYSSAVDLADDLDRFVRGEPIVARPIGYPETAWKWAKRRPAAALLVAVSLASLMTVAVLTANYTAKLKTSLVEEDVQRQRAEAALASETKRRTQTREALDRLCEQLISDGWKTPRKTDQQIASLEQALKAYEEFAADSADDETSRYSAAKAFFSSGRLQQTLGRPEHAEKTLLRAVDAYSSLARDFPDRRLYQVGWSASLHDRATVRQLEGRHQESADDYRKAAEIQRLMLRPDVPSDHALLARTLRNLVSPLYSLQHPDAVKAEAEAMAIFERLIAAHPNDEFYRVDLAAMFQNRGSEAMRREQLGQAEADYRRAKELRTPNNKLIIFSDSKNDQAQCHYILGVLASRRNATPEAIAEFFRALDLWIAVTAERPNVQAYYQRIGDSFTLLNRLMGPHLKAAELEPYYRKYRPLVELRANTERDDDSVLTAGATLCNHGYVLKAMTRSPEALQLFSTAIEWLEKIEANRPDYPKARQFRANALAGAAAINVQLGPHAEAARQWQQAAAEDKTPRRVIYQIDYAGSLARSGDAVGALAAAEAVDAPTPAHAFSQATVYCLIYNVAADETIKQRAESLALSWLTKARAVGQLRDAAVQKILRQSADWAPLRDRHSIDTLLNGQID